MNTEEPRPEKATPRWDDREKLERDIQESCRKGEFAQAMEWALVGHGPAIMRLMASVLHDYRRSRAAFSLFSEKLRHGLPDFRWECSFRTWAYRLARNACYQVQHLPPDEEKTESSSGPMDEAQRQVLESRPWQRTSIKERVRALREKLSPQERILLLLRVDQRLSWREVARVMSDGDEPLTDEVLDREAAALRQQFKHTKSRLRAMGVEAGLITGEQASPH